MAAYLIVDLEVNDSEKIAEYRRSAGPTVAKHGGRLLVRNGAREVLEGSWTPKELLIIEFPSMQELKNWYNSEEYRPLIDLRKAAARGNLIAIEGVQAVQ
jgi:uncharacterized protein (DUF1330 family)